MSTPPEVWTQTRHLEADAVADLLARLGQRLPGHGRMRAGMLAEVADCLRSAQEDYAGRGHDAAESARLAVDDFGSVDECAAQYRTELSAAAARRTAIFVSIGYPVMMAMWAVVSAVKPVTHDYAPHWITGSFSWITVAALLSSVGVLWSLRSPRRPAPSIRRLTAVAAVVVLVAAVFTLGASLLTAQFGASAPGTPVTNGIETAVEWLSGTFVISTTFSAVRCLLTRRGELTPAV